MYCDCWFKRFYRGGMAMAWKMGAEDGVEVGWKMGWRWGQ